MENVKTDVTSFLEGKYVYLRPPDIQKDVLDGPWFSWFNDKDVTKYLGQGVFPNTVEKQADFVRSLKTDTSRIVLCIIEKVPERHIGVISLHNINLLDKKAVISIVMGEKKYAPEAPLEAMALLTEHGFDRLNLNKIDAGQSIELWKWVNTIGLIGYRIEGYIESIMVRDGKVHDGVHTGITAERFYRLREERNGNICTENLLGLLRTRRRDNVPQTIKALLDGVYGTKGE